MHTHTHTDTIIKKQRSQSHARLAPLRHRQFGSTGPIDLRCTPLRPSTWSCEILLKNHFRQTGAVAVQATHIHKYIYIYRERDVCNSNVCTCRKQPQQNQSAEQQWQSRVIGALTCYRKMEIRTLHQHTQHATVCVCVCMKLHTYACMRGKRKR